MSEKVKRPRLMVLNEPDGRRFSKALALEIGRDHAEVFLQIEYLISISTTPMMNEKLWTRSSVAYLQEYHFPYWGKTFIANILKDLSEGYQTTRFTYAGEGRARHRIAQKIYIEPLLDKGWFNWGGDTTTWYSLNFEGIAKLTSVKMDMDALTTVSGTRKRVSRNAETGFQSSGNQLPQEREPVATHAGDFHTETSTETSTEGGRRETETIPEPPPNFPPGLDASLLERSKDFDTPNTILATRLNFNKDRAAMLDEFIGA